MARKQPTDPLDEYAVPYPVSKRGVPHPMPMTTLTDHGYVNRPKARERVLCRADGSVMGYVELVLAADLEMCTEDRGHPCVVMDWFFHVQLRPKAPHYKTRCWARRGCVIVPTRIKKQTILMMWHCWVGHYTSGGEVCEPADPAGPADTGSPGPNPLASNPFA